MTHSQSARLGNWGRWGDDDERGALNLLTPEVVLAAIRVCKTGHVYNLGLPVARSGAPVFDFRGAPQRLTLTSPTDPAMRAAIHEVPEGFGSCEDVVIVASHNGTHIDALSHIFSNHHFYNGFPASEYASHTGAPHCGIEKAGGFAGRAVILDVARYHGVDWLEPGTNVSADDLEGCRRLQGVELGAGDILLVRTGALDLFASLQPGQPRPRGQAGLGATTIEYIADHDLAAVGADNAAVEVIPFDGAFHVETLVNRGIPLLEHLVLSELAGDGVSECFLVVAPLLIPGASGSPINPVAIA
jgi:kynurenine formamidase